MLQAELVFNVEEVKQEEEDVPPASIPSEIENQWLESTAIKLVRQR